MTNKKKIHSHTINSFQNHGQRNGLYVEFLDLVQKVAVTLCIVMGEVFDVQLDHGTLLEPFLGCWSGAFWGSDDDVNGSCEHCAPYEPERDEHDPAKSDPERIVRVLHQLFFAHPGKGLFDDLDVDFGVPVGCPELDLKTKEKDLTANWGNWFL